MAPLAGPQITLMMLKAMSHDLSFRISQKTDMKMRISQSSIFLGNTKASLYQSLAQYATNTQGYNAVNAQIQQLAAREQAIASYEKMIDMEITNLQNQLKQVQAREEAAQKMVDEGCKSIAGSMGRG